MVEAFETSQKNEIDVIHSNSGVPTAVEVAAVTSALNRIIGGQACVKL
jgi:hypothetical protein